MAKNVRINPVTGEREYYFPMELTSPEIRADAIVNGYEIGMARLGFRYFEAAFIPCKKTSRDAMGREIYLNTTSAEQHHLYKELCKDELNAQEDIKQEGRCNIPDGKGGYKRCPLRVANPNYAPSNGQTKTIAVKCIGCKYEQFRQEHTIIGLSCLAHQNDECDVEEYDIPTPNYYCIADRYLKLRDDFIDFIKVRNPKLTPLAEMLCNELKKSDAARELGLASSTVGSRNDKIKELLLEFLDNTTSI